ncbi:protein lingerer-like, partial [Copidosoma floridanum]|uniref:protein lingerer-like n=1 Tax=Copidosoma floridanum TaxID=29053 RepID=UPI0006C9629D
MIQYFSPLRALVVEYKLNITGHDLFVYRSWRRRENKENEKNLEDIKYESNCSKKGRNLSSRSGRGGRGSSRGFSSRSLVNKEELSSSSNSFSRPIDTWTGNEDQLSNRKESKIDSWNSVDAAEEWDNEEYTGSLADTKVFTPSTINNESIAVSEKHEGEEIFSTKPLQSTIIISNIQRQIKNRPRLPPPSKIPSSAVEMPGDTLSNSISFLDVQFGALEFGSDANIDTTSQDKYNSNSNSIVPNIESALSSKTVVSSMSTLTDGAQISPSQKFTAVKM